jgi:hypothetical protein
VKTDFSLKRSALLALLDQVLYPNPDDWDGPGPAGPVIRWPSNDPGWAWLNRETLPPRSPHPEPWRAVFIARFSIDRAAQQVERSAASDTAESAERVLPGVRTQLSEMVDEWCGVRPPKWPWPWPPRPGSTQLRPLDLLLAGAQFERAAQLANPLRHDFARLSEQLFEAGLSRLALTSEVS